MNRKNIVDITQNEPNDLYFINRLTALLLVRNIEQLFYAFSNSLYILSYVSMYIYNASIICCIETAFIAETLQ